MSIFFKKITRPVFLALCAVLCTCGQAFGMDSLTPEETTFFDNFSLQVRAGALNPRTLLSELERQKQCCLQQIQPLQTQLQYAQSFPCNQLQFASDILQNNCTSRIQDLNKKTFLLSLQQQFAATISAQQSSISVDPQLKNYACLFAQKVFLEMAKFEKFFPTIDHKKIEAFVKQYNTIQVFFNNHLFSNPIGTQALGSNNYFSIFINPNVLGLNMKKLEAIICHEVAHSKLNHTAVRPNYSHPQSEFEAETLCALTLHSMNNIDAIKPHILNHQNFSLSNTYSCCYLLGFINGIKLTGDQQLKETLIDNASSNMSNWTNKHIVTLLLKYWKPVDTIDNAMKQAQEIVHHML